MALINQGKREVNFKVVYWGPGLGGKTENILFLSRTLLKKEPIVLSTPQGRTLFFDFSPLEIKTPSGYKIRYSLYTTPGQIIYSGARKLLLEGADGIVFVADSQRERKDTNLFSFEELLRELQRRNLFHIPLVLQYNKRDLADIMTVEEMRALFNPDNRFIEIEAVATKGVGVKETFKEIANQILQNFQNSCKRVVSTSLRINHRPVQPYAVR